MEPTNLPLYPKYSSIYNKIMQLAIAIVLIIVLLNLWLVSSNQSQATIDEHFYVLGDQHIEQAIMGVKNLQLIENKEDLNKFTQGLADADWVHDIRIYDATGQVIADSEKSRSMKDLYGITLNKTNKSDKLVPFIKEIRTDKLIGYVRITIKKEIFTQKLDTTSYENHGLLRLMMLISIAIGFLLTRGLNRFSRQGYRLPVEK